MKESGWILLIIGVVAVLIGALMDVSVATNLYGSGGTYAPGGSYLPPVPSSVANLHKMHIQALVIQGGFATILCGVILAVAGAIVDAIREGRDPPAGSTSPAPASLPQPLPAAGPEEEPPQERDTQSDDKVQAWIIGVIIAVILAVVFAAVISSSGAGSANHYANNIALDADNAANAALEDTNEIIDSAPPR